MLNITYSSKFENEKQLIRNNKLPQKAIQFKEDKKIKDIYNLGFILELPIIITIVRIQGVDGHINLNLKTGIIIVVAILINYILKFLHEYIHAILYPIKSKKQYRNTLQKVLILYIVIPKFLKNDLLLFH